MISKKWGQREIDLAKIKNEDLKECYEITEELFEKMYATIASRDDRDVRKAVELIGRLINGFPLTPITDDPKEWTPCISYDLVEGVGCTIYSAVRRPSLMKRVTMDGDKKNIEYVDRDRYEVIDINTMSIINEHCICETLIDGAMPITIPYLPYAKIKIFVDRFKNDLAEYIWLMHIRDMTGVMIQIDRYLRVDRERGDISIEEITRREFMKNKYRKKEDQNGKI